MRPALVGLCIAATLSGGCGRAYYREQADADAAYLTAEKKIHPHFPLYDSSIAISPASRMFDPFDPDHPPLPPDDPFAHQYMHEVDGKKGYPHWHDWGDTRVVENPYWLACLPTDEDGCVVLTADKSVELALLHSPEYQEALEDLYLSALDVSFERFLFDSQFYAGVETFFTADGPLRQGANGESSSTLEVNAYSTGGQRPFSMERQFAAGGSLVVGLANSLMWEFSGPDTQSAFTVLDFSLIQPLLRNGGRERVLERLTLAERTLLGNVRQMERFRRGFYVEVVTGRNSGSAPSRLGGVFGGAGLQGFSGVGGGFGNLGGGGGGGAGGLAGGGGAGAAQAGGYLGLLQQQQEIRNLEANLARLRVNLYELKEFRDASELKIGADPAAEAEDVVLGLAQEQLQVSQAQQAVFEAEGQLLNSVVSYQNQLDDFKTTLGLPPSLCVKIEDPMLDPFYLQDVSILPELNQVADSLTEIRDVRDASRNLRNQARQALFAAYGARARREAAPDAPLEDAPAEGEAEALPDQDPAAPIDGDQLAPPAVLQELAEPAAPTPEGVREAIEATDEQIAADLSAAIAPYVRQLDLELGGLVTFDFLALSERLEEREPEVYERLRASMADVRERVPRWREGLTEENVEREILFYLKSQAELGRLGRSVAEAVDAELTRRQLLDEYATRPDRMKSLFGEIDVALAPLSGSVRLWWDAVNGEALEATREMTSVVPELREIELDDRAALDIAQYYRRDWMNARAALVDTWRLIWFNADQLQAGLDLVLQGDVQNVGDNPINFNKSTGRIRAGFQFDAPLTRLGERNTYRQSLIEYQQARRSYYQFVDGVSQTLRTELRTIEANKINYEIRKQAVLNAIEQIDVNELLQERRRITNTLTGPTAARDAVQALADLQRALDDFLSVKVNYEVLRMSLDFDLGTMELTPDGLWIDPGPITSENNYSVPIYPDCPLPEPPDILVLPPNTQPATDLGADAEEAIPPGRRNGAETLPSAAPGAGRPVPNGAVPPRAAPPSNRPMRLPPPPASGAGVNPGPGVGASNGTMFQQLWGQEYQEPAIADPHSRYGAHTTTLHPPRNLRR
ncbi:MAG TPA: TolC family protein [Pirellulaceae bacterium]|nr:TolC family protein [Pirellulaceae bacterium]